MGALIQNLFSSKAEIDSIKHTAELELTDSRKATVKPITQLAEYKPNQFQAFFETIFYAASLVDFIQFDRGEVLSRTFTFTNADIINDEVTKVHNLGSNILDVTVLNQLGEAIELATTVDTSKVVVDVSRASIIGTWKILVEQS